MKKFLFTLVAFLMAGSMFADNYFYVEDFEVTPEFLAQESGKARQLDVAVWAHFDDMVSGWQTNMTLPEGVTVRNAEAAEGMTIHGLNALGNPKDYNVALSSNLETQRFIGASTEAGYYYPEGADPDEDDPTPIGANKWLPGDYKMFIMTLRFAQDFAGGQITFETTAASGQDPRIDSGEYSAPTGETWYAPEELICDVVVAGDNPPTPTYAPEPKIFWNADNLTVEAYVVDDNGNKVDNYTVVLMANGTEIDNPKTYTQTTEAQTINFSAYTVKDTEDNNSATVYYEANPVIIPAQAIQTPAPTIAIDESMTTDDYVYIRATGEGEVTLYLDGVEVDNPYQVARPEYDYDGDYALIFSATAHVDGQIDGVNAGTRIVIPKKPEPQQPEVVLPGELIFNAVDMEGTDGGKFTVEYVGDIEGVTVEVVDMIPANRGEYQLDGYGKWLVKAKATATGYLPLEDEAEFEWVRVDAPAATTSGIQTDPTEVTFTAAGSNVKLYADEACTEEIDNPYTVARPAYDPENDASYTETVYAVTTAENAEPTVTPLTFNVPEQLPTPNVEIKIENVNAWLPGQPEDSELENGKSYNAIITVPAEFADNVWYTINDGEPIKWDGNDIPLMGTGDVTVTAWVAVDNDKSPEGSDSATMIENNFTGVNEIANGKAVAGVRYFNMAGQEMQEANGVTIVVTTYTDGTTSAVKVMK